MIESAGPVDRRVAMRKGAVQRETFSAADTAAAPTVRTRDREGGYS
jgi:hypothetical protein